ncbi:histidine kinase [Streptomyces sp. RFCAC02]|uniref:sensor histidine kinase n=1 Tax=Streptomyces sp. RFCAC02 TaxID=2499143 RepID=UPI00101E957B|nr:histidine kinase [Streptomyces sp. RFCAC02]
MTEPVTAAPRGARDLRAVRAALAAPWHDLGRDLVAERHLPALGLPAAVTAGLPAPARRALRPSRRLSYGLVGIVAVLLTLGAGAWEQSDFADDARGTWHVVLIAVPLLLATTRPVLGFWLSLGSLALQSTWSLTSGSWPFSNLAIAAHILVMLTVMLSARPRAAVPMWLLTTATGLLVTARGGNPTGNSDHIVCAAFALAALTIAVLLRAWADSRHQVAAQSAVTERERSRRTVLEERTAIARELHDVVAHHMSVVAIQAEAAPYRVADPPPELVRAFATIRENAVTALTELRRVLGVVRAPADAAPDAPQPTLAQVDTLLARVGDAGLPVEKAVTGAVRELPPGVELSAYRIVQEALSNALRHAPGAATRVELSYVIGGLGLRVVNGPPAAVPPPRAGSPGAGHGLTGMRERAAMLDGDLTAGATPDGGWETTAFLPVPPTRSPEPA